MCPMPLVTVLILASAATTAAQDPADGGVELNAALLRWAEAFDDGSLDPAGNFRRSAKVYGVMLEPGGVLVRYAHSLESFTNEQMLERLVTAAEQLALPTLAPGLLAAGAVGLDRSPLDVDAMRVRELAAAAAARAGAASRDFAAAVLAIAADPRSQVEPRVAALRSFAFGESEDQRAVLVDGLADEDVRVRLSAAESLRLRRDGRFIVDVAAALRSESHPVVAQALVQTLASCLRREARGPATESAVETAIGRIGALGWRVDLELVELIAQFPLPAGVPPLVALLDGPAWDQRRLRNKGTPPLLRGRAIEVLRAITGARLPEDSANAWRAFWEQEGPNVRLRGLTPTPRVGRTTTRGWFGIEIRGRETVFVLDASRSMRTAIGVAGPDARQSRLEQATQQLIEVAQDMPREWRLRVVAFADEPQVWNDRGLAPDPRTMRSLSAFLASKLPNGRSDLRKALAVALGAEGLRFAELADHPVEEIFVLSDGLPTSVDGPEDPDELLAWVRELNRYQKIRINAVMVGDGKSGADFMRRLAAENGGAFVKQ